MVHDQDQGYPMLTPLCASCTRKGLQQEKEHARVRGTLVMEASGHLTRRLLWLAHTTARCHGGKHPM